MNYYQHHIGDFNSATRHLTRVERSLYRDLIELYYEAEQPLNSDIKKLARRVMAHTDEEFAALQTVLDEFFVLQDDGWHNARCDAEISKYRAQLDQASKAGKASAAKRQKPINAPVQRPFNDRSTTVQPTNNQEPINKNNPPLPPTSSAGGECARGVIAAEMDDRFDRFWKAYPRKVGKDAARRAFAKRKPSEALLAKMLAAIAMQSQTVDWLREGGRFVPHPATWLNQGRWQDGEDDGAHDPHDGNGGYDWRKNPMFAGVI